jgi:hypothetical protein
LLQTEKQAHIAPKTTTAITNDFDEWMRLGAELVKDDSIEARIRSGNACVRHGFI